MAGARSYLLPPPEPNASATDPAIIAFYVLLILGGNVLMPIMILASFVQKNQYSRSPILMNFCVSCVVYSIGFLLSLYAGWWKGDVEPIPWLCEFQAMLVYVLPVWVVATALAFVFELWMGLTGRTGTSSFIREPRARLPLRTLILLIFPYFCVVFMGVATNLVVQARPDLVGFEAIFCSVDFQPLRMTVAVFTALTLALGFGLQFDIGRRLYGGRHAGKSRLQDWRDASLCIRMLIFLTLMGIGGIAAIFAGTHSYRYPRQIIQALLPLLVWLIFGTNPAMYKPDPTPISVSKA